MAETDPATGEKLFLDVIKPETIYGPSKSKWDCPDLLLVSQDGIKVNRRTRGKWIATHIPPEQADGTHLLKGLWMAGGPKIKISQQFQANIHDIAPTVLTLMGLPVPNDMDGRVLREAIVDILPIRLSEDYADDTETKSKITYSAEEEKHIQQQLADLGYLD